MVQEFINKIPKDKLLHFVVGSLVYASTSWLLGYYALIAVLVVAVGKEMYDFVYGGTVDKWDVVATMAGGITVLIGGYYYGI